MSTHSSADQGRGDALQATGRLKVVRAVIVTPLVFLTVVIIGAVLISSGVLPRSLSPVLRIAGQTLPILATLALASGVVVAHRRRQWVKEMAFHFTAGGIVQIVPLFILMHHHPAILALPFAPGAFVAAYSVLERRNQVDVSE
ncbi:hypothetical protein ABT075_06175 [Streptomyces sp. NPDC002677]|uniref:hypothetical protein n=1 Tax=Streptomyces sp. NPDC002677 TaxID=3154774 RepID=UPI00333071C5